MRYLDVCAGISASTVAWKPLGWQAAAYSEIESAPRAILAHHYPDVPLHGDFTTIGADEYGPIDLLVGGTPCQDFSVAGLRAGLGGDRGNLSLQFLLLLARTRARWVVWENVPGVFSSLSHDAPDARPPEIDLDGDDGPEDGEEVVVEDEYGADESHALGCFLAGLSELGYGFAYRVLDAQFAGVPQRRRRIFVVGYLGDWRRAAAVLFERHSLSGHPAPRREAGEGVARPIAAGTRSNGGYRNDADTADNLIAATVSSKWAKGSGGPSGGPSGDECQNLLSVSQAYSIMPMNSGRDYVARPTNIAQPLMAAGPVGGNQDGDFITHALRGEGFDASEDGTGRGTPLVPVAFNSREDLCHSERVFGALGSSSPQSAAVAFMENQQGAVWEADTFQALNRGGGKPGQSYPAIRQASAVRRLTPRECERLQGFPDDYTLVPYRRGMMADGPRYKALGNSMAVPVMRWIGERIAAVEALQHRVAA